MQEMMMLSQLPKKSSSQGTSLTSSISGDMQGYEWEELDADSSAGKRRIRMMEVTQGKTRFLGKPNKIENGRGD
jgi:hypothetical protein